MSQAILELSVGVSQAFHQLLGSFLRLGIHVNARASLGQLVDMMARRVEQKVSPQVDLDIVRSKLALVDVKIEQFHREIRRNQLSILRGTKVLVETPDLGECSLDLELEESQLVARALELSPAIRMHDATLSALAAEADALRLEHYPKIVGGYRVDTDVNGDNFDQQGYLALRLEIQTGGNLDSRIAAGRAQVLERRALRETETEAIVQQVSDLVSEYATARRLVSIQKTLAESRATEGVILATFRRGEGLVGRCAQRLQRSLRGEIRTGICLGERVQCPLLHRDSIRLWWALLGHRIMTEPSPDLEAAVCLSLVASAHGCGVSSARFFELIREADAGESIADRVCSVWRTQFPSGRCQSVELEALDMAGLPAICIDARSGYSYVVRDLSGTALSLRNSTGDSTADRDGAHGWSFLSFETGRQQTNSGDPAGDARSWFRMAFSAHRVVFRDVAVASALVSLLALCAAIYTMQVYDRVVPTGSYPTLLVLTVGVILGILLEASPAY